MRGIPELWGSQVNVIRGRSIMAEHTCLAFAVGVHERVSERVAQLLLCGWRWSNPVYVIVHGHAIDIIIRGKVSACIAKSVCGTF